MTAFANKAPSAASGTGWPHVCLRRVLAPRKEGLCSSIRRGPWLAFGGRLSVGCGSKPMVIFWLVGAPPILVYFSWDWDVHRGYRILTHCQSVPRRRERLHRRCGVCHGLQGLCCTWVELMSSGKTCDGGRKSIWIFCPRSGSIQPLATIPESLRSANYNRNEAGRETALRVTYGPVLSPKRASK